LQPVVELDGVLEGDAHHAEVCCLALGDLGWFSNGWDRSQCKGSDAGKGEVEFDGCHCPDRSVGQTLPVMWGQSRHVVAEPDPAGVG